MQIGLCSKMSIKIVLILAIFINASVHANQILDNLSDSEIRRIFHQSRDQLPNYKTTTLKTKKIYRAKREVRPVEFTVDGKKVELNLTPSKYNALPQNTPVWTVETDYGKSTKHRFNKLDQSEINFDGVLYEDQKHMATLLAYYKGPYIFYDGIFQESMNRKIVRSLPESWRTESGNESHDDHVIFDVDQADSRTEIIEDNDPDYDNAKLDKPLDILYPKLLLIIEYNYFKKLSENVVEAIKYAVLFWNSVNLKYSTLESPEVKVAITGVIIAKDDTALRFVYEARNRSDMNAINHVSLLNGASDYFRGPFKNEVRFYNYDSTMTMTNLNTGIIAGSAYRGRICGSSYNTGFVRDNSNFNGLLAATHELGHLLNLPHDGQSNAKGCVSYQADKRAASIMAPYDLAVDKYYWSRCSKKILHDFATTKGCECMKYPYRR